MHNCKFCFCEDVRENLISPCFCTGNIKYVHRKCLDSWRNSNVNNQNFYTCEVCKKNFVFEIIHYNIPFSSKLFFGCKLLLLNLFIIFTIYIVGKLRNLFIDTQFTIINNTYFNDFIIGLLLLSISTLIISCILFLNYNHFGFQHERNLIYLLNYKFFLIYLFLAGLFIMICYILKIQIIIIKNKYQNYTNEIYSVKDLDK